MVTHNWIFNWFKDFTLKRQHLNICWKPIKCLSLIKMAGVWIWHDKIDWSQRQYKTSQIHHIQLWSKTLTRPVRPSVKTKGCLQITFVLIIVILIALSKSYRCSYLIISSLFTPVFLRWEIVPFFTSSFICPHKITNGQTILTITRQPPV